MRREAVRGERPHERLAPPGVGVGCALELAIGRGIAPERRDQVLEQMAQGKNNAAIAKALFLTERAVEKHINSLFHKLGLSEEEQVHRRVMAVLAFLREEGIPDGG